jgi:UDP-glucose 4-epimerase
MRILLTGGSGFLGKNIKNSHLADKYKIFSPSHTELDIVKDIKAYVIENQIDIIIHAAIAPGYKDKKNEALFKQNTAMSASVASCRDLVRKIIFFSSGASVEALTSYGAAKHIEEAFATKDSNIYSLRLFGVYGPLEDYGTRFVSNMICKALLGLPMTIKKDRRFSYIWIEDLLHIIDAFIQVNWPTHVLNITPDHDPLLSEIACIVRDKCHAELPIVLKDCSLGCEYTGDNDELRQLFPDMELTPIEKGIEKLIEYYKFNIQSIERSKLLEDK